MSPTHCDVCGGSGSVRDPRFGVGGGIPAELEPCPACGQGGYMTMEQAKKAYDEAPDIPLSEKETHRIIEKVLGLDNRRLREALQQIRDQVDQHGSTTPTMKQWIRWKVNTALTDRQPDYRSGEE